MHKTLEYAEEMQTAFDREAQGFKADELRNRAEWARMAAVELRKQGMARAKALKQANGEILPSSIESPLYNTLAIPDQAAVDASLERSRLLLQYGTDVAAMALDAADSIKATNSLEKMLAHQLAALHKQAMDQLAQVPCERDAAGQAKRLHAAARCTTVYRQGFLALHKVRQNGRQRITVQYVHMSQGSQAVIGHIERDRGRDVEPQSAIPPR